MTIAKRKIYGELAVDFLLAAVLTIIIPIIVMKITSLSFRTKFFVLNLALSNLMANTFFYVIRGHFDIEAACWQIGISTCVSQVVLLFWWALCFMVFLAPYWSKDAVMPLVVLGLIAILSPAASVVITKQLTDDYFFNKNSKLQQDE
jgi:hypothetical protein